MRALGARRHVAQRDGPNFLELRRIAPDVHKLRLPHVAAGQRKLHAGINVSVGRDIASRVAGAAGQHVQGIFVRRLAAGRRIPPRCRPAPRFGKLPAKQPGPHSNSRMDLSPSIMGVMVGSIVNCASSSAASALTPRIILGVLDHEHIGHGDVQALRPQETHRFDRLPERAGHLGNGVMHFGRDASKC